MLGFTKLICFWYFWSKLMFGFTDLICFCIWHSNKIILELTESILRKVKVVKIKEEIEEEEKYELDAVMEEILHRLPAAQLQTLKTVCKNWYQIISSPYLVGLHLNRFNERRIRILMPKNRGVTIEYTNYCDEEMQVEICHPPVISRRMPVVLGSCDGLLCLLLIQSGSDHRWVAIYNPSTDKYFFVKHCPDVDRYNYFMIFCSWFGYHPSCEEYVLVLGLVLPKEQNSRYKVRVYKFGSELKPIHSETCFVDGLITCFEERGVLLRGAVHWPAERIHGSRSPSSTVISVYHLDSNKHWEISTPPVSYSLSNVGVAQGCLFVIFKPEAAYVFEMWIMKEYGVHQSWTKYANIHGFSDSRVLSPLGFFPNGDLILDDKFKVIRYSFNHNKAVILMINKNHNHSALYGATIMCADSLVFPAIRLVK